LSSGGFTDLEEQQQRQSLLACGVVKRVQGARRRLAGVVVEFESWPHANAGVLQIVVQALLNFGRNSGHVQSKRNVASMYATQYREKDNDLGYRIPIVSSYYPTIRFSLGWWFSIVFTDTLP
jgi:hypothetical protein